MSSGSDKVELKLNRVKIEANNLDNENLKSLIDFFARHRIRDLDAPILDSDFDLKALSSTLEEVTLD